MSDKPAILVTGGAGFIGAHACRAIEAAGYQPIVYDNLSTGHRSFVRGPLVIGNLIDKARLARVFAEHDIVAVMYFAAASLVGESMSDPQKYYINNVAGTLSLLEAMHSSGCRRIVFSSTGAVYGNADSKALRGEHDAAAAGTMHGFQQRQRAGDIVDGRYSADRSWNRRPGWRRQNASRRRCHAPRKRTRASVDEVADHERSPHEAAMPGREIVVNDRLVAGRLDRAAGMRADKPRRPRCTVGPVMAGCG